MKLLDNEHFGDLITDTKQKELTTSYWTSHERKRWVVLLFTVSAALYAARVAMPVCAAAMAKEFHWNKAELGTAMGAFFWGYLTTQILGGYMADRVGGDKVLCISAFMWGGITFLTPFVAHVRFPLVGPLVLLTLIRVLLGVSQGVHYPSLISVLGKKIPEKERSFPNGIILSAGSFGILLCGGIGSLILEHQGWEVVFYFIGIAAFLCGFALYSDIRKSTNQLISLKNLFQSHNQVISSTERVPWHAIFTKKEVWSLLFVHGCMNNCHFIFLSWLPTFFHDTFPDEKGWIYNTIPYALSVPSSAFAGWVSERMINAKFKIGFTRKLMQVIAMGGSGLLAVILPYCSQFVVALCCVSVLISVTTFHHSGVLVNPQDIAPKHSGSVFGIMNVAGAFSGFVGVYISGQILNIFNSWVMVFVYVAVVNCVGVSVFVLWGTGMRIL